MFPAANVVMPETAPLIVPPDNFKNVVFTYEFDAAYATALLYAVVTSLLVATVE